MTSNKMDATKVQEQTISVENMDNKTLLKVVADGLGYEMQKDALVKPLEVIKIKTQVNVPMETEEVDEETGDKIMAMQVQEVEIDSSFRTGIVLALPVNYEGSVVLGDTIAYPNKYSIDFDLFKDSVLVKPYDIIAIVK
jgi:hypothetical protein